MNLLKYFLIINDISVVLPDIDVSGFTTYESTVILLLVNVCAWFFIYIILGIIFKILVRFK